jgi:hypothetical protein
MDPKMLLVSLLTILAKALLAGTLSPFVIQFFKQHVFVKVKHWFWKWLLSLTVSLLAGVIISWNQGIFTNWQATVADYSQFIVALSATWGFCQWFWKTTFEQYFSGKETRKNNHT